MKKGKLVVIWNNQASVYFKNAYEKIKGDSVTNAEKIREGITEACGW